MFKKGELVNIKSGNLSMFNPWTVLEESEPLLGNMYFEGHYGNEAIRGTPWDGHCWYIPRVLWEAADFTLENE